MQENYYIFYIITQKNVIRKLYISRKNLLLNFKSVIVSLLTWILIENIINELNAWYVIFTESIFNQRFLEALKKYYM